LTDPGGGIDPACLACGARQSTQWATATDEEYHSGTERYSFRRCQACGVLFIQPVPRDRLHEIYPANYYSFAGPDRSWVQRLKATLDRRLFRSLLRRLPGPALRVLDVGGGTGWELTLIRSIDPRVKVTVVVDIDEGAAAGAMAGGHQYFCGRIEDYSTEERFDLVLMLNIIEHVEDPAAVLEKVAALLAPNGVVLVKTPNYDSADARLFRHRNWAGYHCPRHWVLFTKESFIALARRSGLALQGFKYTQGAPFWATSIVIQLAKKNIIDVSAERPPVNHRVYGALSAVFATFDFARRPFAKLSQMFLVLAAQADDGYPGRETHARLHQPGLSRHGEAEQPVGEGPGVLQFGGHQGLAPALAHPSHAGNGGQQRGIEIAGPRHRPPGRPAHLVQLGLGVAAMMAQLDVAVAP
jgi:2-polyprenyl-3-methyl-5-hydroxy-6-metoxy-1,4-benzoquinol methylase